MDLDAVEREIARLDGLALPGPPTERKGVPREVWLANAQEAGRKRCAPIQPESVPLMVSLLYYFAASDAPTRERIRELLGATRTSRGAHHHVPVQMIQITGGSRFCGSRHATNSPTPAIRS